MASGKFSGPINRLVIELMKLPGIGEKTAQRLAFYLVKMNKEEAKKIAEAILDVVDNLKLCQQCNNFSDEELCAICRDPERNKVPLICVVEEANDLISIEKTGEFKGTYHILMGALSPLQGIGPEDLKIEQLIKRLNSRKYEEVIIATNPSVEGEATAMYLSKLIKPLGIKVTRIAYGVPAGGDLEYADVLTMTRALEGRREML